jgi:hypothetical protein
MNVQRCLLILGQMRNQFWNNLFISHHKMNSLLKLSLQVKWVELDT